MLSNPETSVEVIATEAMLCERKYSMNVGIVEIFIQS